MKTIAIVLFVPLFIISIFPQQISSWQNYTDMKSVKDITEAGGGLWAATGGGGFFYNFSDNSFLTLRKSDGLNSISLTAVTVDNYNKIWFGSSDGTIDIYDPADNSYRTILDIFNSDKSSKQINSLITSGDTIIAATDFGISLIDSKNFIFFETFSKFGSLPSNIKIYNANMNGLLFASTELGVVVQKNDAVNLSAPESWNVYQTSNGLPSNNISKVISYNGFLIAATNRGLSIFNGSMWEPFIPELNNRDVKDIIAFEGSIYILANNQIILYLNSELSTVFTSPVNLTRLFYSNQLGICAASQEGILIFKEGSAEYIVPNGPQANQFPNISVDNNGTFWSASGRDGRGVGVYKFDGETWINYNSSNSSLTTNDYNFAFAAPDNTVYFGAWGNGFASIKDGSIKIYDASNTDIEGVDQGPDFIVISGFAIDSRNNLWVLNSEAVNKKTLSMLTPDSIWYHFIIPAAQNRFLDNHYNLAIDQYDTKWFNTTAKDRRGLYYFNENKTYDDPSDDRSGYITEANGLNDNTINSIIVDRRGDVWVGTILGVNIISNTNNILSQANPQLRISSLFSLRQQSINYMAVDPLNQKWIGTNQGLILVNSDGSGLLAAYDTKNSPLLSDEIKSIAIDENNGKVYVGTDAGLTSFETPAIKPEEAFTELFIYPSPFLLNSSSNTLTIDGLIRESEIKILNINGKLVNEFSSPGGRTAYWDGRNFEGELVSTGIYIVVAYDQNGDNVSTGKIAVFKE